MIKEIYQNFLSILNILTDYQTINNKGSLIHAKNVELLELDSSYSLKINSIQQVIHSIKHKLKVFKKNFFQV